MVSLQPSHGRVNVKLELNTLPLVNLCRGSIELCCSKHGLLLYTTPSVYVPQDAVFCAQEHTVGTVRQCELPAECLGRLILESDGRESAFSHEPGGGAPVMTRSEAFATPPRTQTIGLGWWHLIRGITV